MVIRSTPYAKEAAAKKPLAPEGFFYSSAFDAKQALSRLVSTVSRTRSDVVSILVAVENTPGIDTASSSILSSIVDLIYQALSFISNPTDDEISLAAAMSDMMPKPSDAAIKRVAMSDPSGSMAAVMMMSKHTPPAVSDWIATTWNLTAVRDVGPELQRKTAKRSAILSQLIKISNMGVPVNDERVGYLIGSAMGGEGWNSSFSHSVVNGFDHLPHNLFNMVAEFGPKSLSNVAYQKEMANAKYAAVIIKLISNMDHYDDMACVDLVTKFLLNDKVSDAEKIKLYQACLPEGTFFTPSVKKAVSQTFASLNNEKTYEVALEALFDGADTTSVKVLTENINMALQDYKDLYGFLKNKRLLDQADPAFVKLVEALENPVMPKIDYHELFSIDPEEYTVGSFNGIGLNKQAIIESNKFRAMLAAVIMISVGVPVSLALFRTNTTAKDLSDHPEIVQKGKSIVQMKDSSPQASKVVNDLISQSYPKSQGSGMKAPNIPLSMLEGDTPEFGKKMEETVGKTYQNVPPVPPQPVGKHEKQSCDITKPLVDTVITLEEVKGKNYSSAGAGGMMQLMPPTWEAINKRYFGGKYPFHKYNSNSYVNRRFGAIYLEEIKEYLDTHKAQWKTDQLPLILACYHGGIGNITKANFDPEKIKKYMPKTHDYMIRGSNIMGHQVRRL